MSPIIAQLEMPAFAWISAAGSHTHADAAAPGIGAVYLRQFSDFQPGGPLLAPAAGLRLADRPEAAFHIESQQWRPDGAAVVGRLEEIVVHQTIFYAGPDRILAELACTNDGEHIRRLEIHTACHADVESELRASDDRLLVHVAYTPHPMWGAPTRFDETLEIAVRGEGVVFVEPGTWRIDAAPGSETRLRIALLRRNAPEGPALETLLDNPEAGRRALLDSLEPWMNELPGADHPDAALARQAAFSWYWLWFNTQAPAGCWMRPGIVPSRITYGRGVWLWDSAFHIFGLVHGGPAARRAAADQVRILTENMVEGHLPREVWVDTPGHDLQPPGILTQAALLLLERDAALLDPSSLYERLRRNFDWFLENRGQDADPLCAWDGCDSGWDTSPRWDQGRAIAIDLNAWMVIDARCLARLATLAGRDADAPELLAKADAIAAAARRSFWHEDDATFYDRLPDGGWARVVTPAAFWMLYAGIATPEQARAVAQRVSDPKTLGTPHPLTSVAATHPAHRPNEYWRGPVWINLNWIAIRGLQRYGLETEAIALRERTLRLIAGNPVTHEYYRPDTGEAIGAPAYGWTAALFIDLLVDPEGRTIAAATP